MPSTYSPRLRIELIADGEQAGTWGQRTNVNLGMLLETSVAGYRSIAMPDSNYTLSALNGSDDEARYAMLNFTGTLSAAREVVVPSVSKTYVIRNQTTQTLNVKTSSGSTRAVPSGRTAYVMVDGTNTVDAIDHLAALTVSGATSLAGLTVSGAAVLSSSLSVSGTSSLANTDTTNLSYTGTLTGGTGVVNLGSNQFYKDTAGNIGVGVVPSAWASSRKAVELSGGALFASSAAGADVSLCLNMFLNASVQTVYKTTAPIARYRLFDGDHLWLTAPSGSAGGVATVTERMRLVNSSGNLLIGTSSDGGFKTLISSVTNHLGLQFPGIATWGAQVNSSGDFSLVKDGSSTRLSLKTGGQFLINGTATNPFHPDSHVMRSNATADGQGVLILENLNGTNGTSIFVGVGGAGVGYNAANTVLGVYRSSVSGRSINAAGTINASGADYAEFMRKAYEFSLQKGGIAGVNSEGKLTLVYADAVAFLIKSTDPCVVGGDVWGTEEALGIKKPKLSQIEVDPDNTEAASIENQRLRKQYESDLAAFNALYEAERAWYDRMAFCGRCPVNVYNARPGDYIVPKNDGGMVSMQAVADQCISFDEYKKAVGRVIKVLDDGRAEVVIKAV